MKVLCSVFALFLFTSCATAQVLSGLPAKPNVIVLQKKWLMEARNAALDEDQFKILKEREQEDRERRDRERQNQIRIQQGMPTVAPPVRDPATRARGISVTYIYEVKIRNTEEKEIRKLTWDYVFFDPGTEREVGRRRFVSEVRIGPGKTRNVVVRSASSPTGAIDAAQAGKKSRNNLTISIRGMWSEPALSDREKLDSIYQINEILHRVTAKIYSLRLNLHEWTERDSWAMIASYINQNRAIEKEVMAAINFSYKVIVGNHEQTSGDQDDA